MPNVLPPATDYTNSPGTQGAKKAFVTTLRAFIADLLGTDSGDKAAARAALGAAAALHNHAGVYEPANASLAKVNAAQTFSQKQVFAATVVLQQVLEKVTITASVPVTNFDCLTQGVQYFTGAATANWTLNFRGSAGSSLDSVMGIGESLTVTVLASMGATGYLPTVIQVDGSAVTPKVLGGTAWTPDASCINAFTFTIVKTAGATFDVLASKSKYA